MTVPLGYVVLIVCVAAFVAFAAGIYVGMQVRVRHDRDYDNQQGS